MQDSRNGDQSAQVPSTQWPSSNRSQPSQCLLRGIADGIGDTELLGNPGTLQAIPPPDFGLVTDSFGLIRIPRPEGSVQQQRRFMHIPDIEFWVADRKGFRLYDALRNNFSGLVDADSEAMHPSSAKVTYMIEWPGYTPAKRQRNAQRKHGVQCRSRIAKQIAEVVEEFVLERSRCIPSVDDWRIAPGFIEYQHIYLMELRRISLSTWVAALAYSNTM